MPKRKHQQLPEHKLRDVHRDSYIREIGRLKEQHQSEPRPKLLRQIARLERQLKRLA
jgi:hypothetical protein